jgi:hypothetical protein
MKLYTKNMAVEWNRFQLLNTMCKITETTLPRYIDVTKLVVVLLLFPGWNCKRRPITDLLCFTFWVLIIPDLPARAF